MTFWVLSDLGEPGCAAAVPAQSWVSSLDPQATEDGLI